MVFPLLWFWFRLQTTHHEPSFFLLKNFYTTSLSRVVERLVLRANERN